MKADNLLLPRRASGNRLGASLFDSASPTPEGQRGRKRRQRNRRKGLLLQRLEERIVFDAAPPVVAIDAPGEALIGSDVNFSITFDNAATVPAFGPFVDLILPTDGADGQSGLDTPDGIGTTSATFTFLGQTLTPALDTIVPASGEVEHPFLKDGTGAPVVVTGLNPGDRFIVLRLPFGSFEPNQPPAVIEGTTNLSNLADLGVPLTIQARGGYEFGADPLNNPTVDDPSLLLGSFQDAVVNPTLVTLNKVYIGPEDETATGPNFPREYILQLDVAPGQTIENVRLIDFLPPELQFLSITASSPAGTLTGTPQFLPGDNVLEFAFDNPIVGAAGVDATITFEFFAGEFDSSGDPVLQPLDGSFVNSINDVQAIFDWTPIDTRDPEVLDFVAGDLQTEDHILSLQSIAIQKSGQKIGTGPIQSGDTIEYQLDFQVSDYFTFDQIVVTDVLSDGQSVDGTFVPTLVFSDRVGGGSTTFQLGQDFTFTTNPDGTITIVFDVSAAMAGVVGQDGILQGGYTQGNTGIGATGQIVFRSTVDFEFRNPPPGSDPSVKQGDSLSNGVTIAGRVLDNDTLVPTAEVRVDDSGAGFTLITGTLSKEVYAVDGVLVTGPAIFTPGQVVTYRLTYELPKTRFQELVLNDFLPLPVFNVLDADGLGGTLVWTDALFTGTPGDLPSAGQIGYGPGATAFRDLYFVNEDNSPNLSTPAVGIGGNAFSVDFGSFDVDPTVTTIDLLFSIVTQDVAFADGLFLTNQVQAIEANTILATTVGNSIVQSELVGPDLKVIKGVVSTNRPDGVFEPGEPGGVVWGQPGSSTGFIGELTSSELASSPGIDTDISGLDAGDRVRFAIVIENRGGRAAFDTVFNDVIPAGFVVPTDGLNFEIRTGDGVLLVEGTDYLVTALPNPGDPSAFSFEIELLTEIGRGRDADLGTPVDDGTNVLVVTYDLELAQDSEASTAYVNEVEITQYRGIPGDGANYAEAGFGSLTDDATVTTLSPLIAKALIGSSNPDTIGNDLAIGEIGTFVLTVTVPEGVTGGLTVTDVLPPGMQFVELVGVDISGFSGTLNTTPTVTGGVGSGDDVTFAFGDVIATAATGGSENNVFTITYTAQVMDVPGNVGTSLLNQTQLTNVASLTYDTLPPDVTIESNPVVVNVVEPNLVLTKTFSESVAEAGDVLVVTLALENTGLAAAYNVVLTDGTLDFIKFDATSVTNLTTLPGFNFAFDVSNGVITYSGGQINAEQTLQFQFEVSLLDTVLAGEALWNTATVTAAFTLPADPSNDEIRDRSGAEDSAFVVIATPTLDKQFLNGTVIGATNVESSSGADVVIGEQVTFDVLVTLPEGITQSFRVIDNVPVGLRIDSLEIVTLATNSDLLSADFNGVFGATPTLGAPVIGGAPLVLDFGDVSLPGDNDAANNQFVVRLTATVINVLSNQQNVSLTNTAELVFLDPDGPGNLGPAADVTIVDANPANDPTVTVREPLLTVTKGAAFDPPVQGGTEVTFTLVISNSSGQTAYDVTLSDPISPDFDVTAGVIPDSVVTVSGGATVSSGAFEFFDTGGGVFVLRSTLGAEINIPTGGSVQLQGVVNVREDIPVATEIENTANVRWSSLPDGLVGDDPGTLDERTGGDVPDTAPESLDPTSPDGPLNNYALSSGSVITLVSSVDAVKSFVESELNGASGPVVIGDVVTYQIRVQMPEAVAPELIIRDVLPVGMAFVPDSIVLDRSGFNGIVSAPTANPLVGTEFGNGTGIEFVFAEIEAFVDNNPLTNFFTFTYQTVVLDVGTTVGTGANPTVLTNTATHNNGGADPSFS
ncbi:MAG: isopeptide-forming domain-containing fimbrial protein, partial [Planctomycetaceae bacterium]